MSNDPPTPPNPLIFIHGIEKEQLRISKPIISGNEFTITIEFPTKYEYHDFYFLPYGNRYVVTYRIGDRDVTIYENMFDRWWICPDSIRARYQENGHMILITGRLTEYKFLVQTDTPSGA